MNIEKLCDKILSLDSEFSFVGIITNQGRLVDWKSQQSYYVKSLLSIMPPEDRISFFVELAARQKIRRNFDPGFGNANYILTEHEEESTLVVFLNEQRDMAVISMPTHKEISASKIARQIVTMAGGMPVRAATDDTKDFENKKDSILEEYVRRLEKTLYDIAAHEQTRIGLQDHKASVEKHGVVPLPISEENITKSAKKLRPSGLYL